MMFAHRSLAAASTTAGRNKWLTLLFLGTAVGLGLLHSWAAAGSHSMNADGINYLDMGDAYARGDWDMAINSVWSPMYAWILGLILSMFTPPMHLEFPVVHIVNFAIYLIALACFVYFWRQVMRYHQFRIESSPSAHLVALPDWALQGLGYTLFIASSLILIEVWAVTPDMLMAAFVYLAAALVLRVRVGDLRWRTFILLGMVLGLGYLAKAFMLPLSFLFLAITLFAVRNIQLAIPRVLVAFLVLLLFSAPYVAVLSEAKGELTISNAGAFTYAKHVNGVPFAHWQGETPGNGTPVHPSRKIFEAPPVYEFGTPIGGTYPTAYDPSYWYEGLEVYFDFEQQAHVLLGSLLYYYDVFIGLFGALLFGLILWYLMSWRVDWRLAELLSDWGFVFIALAVFSFYAIVTVIGRYIGVFVVLFFADLLANVRLPDTVNTKRISSALSVIIITFMLANILVFNLSGYRDFSAAQNAPPSSNAQAGPPGWPGEVTEELYRLGIEQGDKVAVIGYGFDSFWARMARVQIVAEMLENDAPAFWLGDPALQSEVIQTFASTGAQAVVAEYVPIYASMSGWHQVGESNYFIYLFAE